MDDEERVARWTIFGVLCGFKLVTAVLVFLMLPSASAAVFLVVFHWFWLIPLVVVGVGASIAWFRLVRARAKRDRLRRAEFSLD
jgi:hypothetical protein